MTTTKYQPIDQHQTKLNGDPTRSDIDSNKQPILPTILKNPRKTVIILSAYNAWDTTLAQRQILYAQKAMIDSIHRQEAPFSGILLYPQIMNERIKMDKDIGLLCHMSWIPHADYVAVYTDMGMTDSMQAAINIASMKTKRIEYRSLGKII